MWRDSRGFPLNETPVRDSNRSTNSRLAALLGATCILAVLVPACRSIPDTAEASNDPDPPSTRDRSSPREQTTGTLEVVATFETLEPGGIAVSASGRIFVSFPRYDSGVPYTVAEIVDGQPKPYPDRPTNDRDNEAPGQHLLSAESVTIGPDGDLWILDSARPDFRPTIKGGAKLVRVDLDSDTIERRYVLGPEVARDSTLLADVRIDKRYGEQGVAYITDASPSGLNGLVVLDLDSGEAWRKLDLHPSTRADPEFIGIVEGERFMFDPGGRAASPLSLGANGLAVEANGERLFYRAFADRELYSVRTDVLADPDVSSAVVQDSFRRYGDQGFASDGMAADDAGRIYMTNYEDGAVVRRHPDGTFETVVHDPRLLWPDSLAITEGWLYIVTNQTHREGVFNDGKSRLERPFVLYRTPIDAGPVRLE